MNSPFGGNISIKFINAMNENPNDLSFGGPITFTINNAVKSLSYFDGFTTKQDWDEQIQDVISKKITSPNIAILSTLYSANLPFSDTELHKCGSILINDFIYPKAVCKKWDDFLLLSNNFAGRYLGTWRTPSLDMKFCDDIWGGAGAWGGGNIFYCPIGWGAGSFLGGGDPVNMNNWGTLHEINHNFEQNSAFFRLKSHGQTNTVNLFDLSVISDAGKYRSEINLNNDVIGPDLINNPDWGGWPKLSSMFNVVRYINQVNAAAAKDPNVSLNEWAYYAALLYTVGSYNFTSFTNYANMTYPNSRSDWTPLRFIYFMSQYFHTNMWQLSQNTTRWIKDDQSSWPIDSTKVPEQQRQTAEDKSIIKKLYQEFPAIDFIANQYACGQYLWNQDSNSYEYTTDVNTSFQIPAIAPYDFNFEDFIVCNNKDFQWDSIIFDTKTKCGGSLKVSPENKKHLIYTPNKDRIADVDEFDIEIRPNSSSKAKLPKNYVPGYKFKIKVRQNVNRPVLTSYVPVQTGSMSYDDIFNQIGLNSNNNVPSNSSIKKWLIQ